MNPRELAKQIYAQVGDEKLRAMRDGERRALVARQPALQSSDARSVQGVVAHLEALLRDNALPADTPAEASRGQWRGRGDLPAVTPSAKTRMFDPRGK